MLTADALHGGISLEAHRRACPEHLLPMLDKGTVVEWHRVQAYQDVSLKLILHEVLRDLVLQRANDCVYLPREVMREPLRSLPRLPADGFHLYVSHHNARASTFMKLLA